MASTTMKSVRHRHEDQNRPKPVGCSSNLPEELVVEILVRLPPSCLVKLKSVCRSWRALISSYHFAKSHLHRSIPIHHIAYTPFYSLNCVDHRIGIFSPQSPSRNPITKVVSFSIVTGFPGLDIIGSANGLLCLLDSDRRRGFSRARLWNPFTGMESEWLNIDGVFSNTGFGYDHVHSKYKLFGEFSKKSGESLFSGICTLGEDSNSWRTIEDLPKGIVDGKATFVPGTGALTWLCLDGIYDGHGAVVVSLDLAKEAFRRFSTPHNGDERDNLYRPTVGVLKNCFAMCFDHKKTHWAVWLMKEYGNEESWTLVVMIPHDEQLRCVVPMHLLEEGEEEDLLLARGACTKIFLCNLKDGSLDFPVFDSTSDGMLGSPLSEGVSIRSFQIVHETLVSPSHFGLPSSFSAMPLIQ